jgi:glutathione S-transferase
MDLYYSNTSPYARLVRIALREKGLDGGVTPHLVDPWADDADLMRVNPLVRVPALVTDGGQALTEALVIALYLETAYPEPPLVPAGQRAAVLARAGVAVGAVDAAVHTLVGRRIAGPDFDASPVGLRRRRGMEQALDRLERDPPGDPGATLDLGAIAAAVLIDYLPFRIPNVDWLQGRPRLAAWHQAGRPSLAETVPRA